MTTSDSTEASRRARPDLKRRARLLGFTAAIVASLHWCHPPTPDINIFHRHDGQVAAPVTDVR